ncbi:MAG: hypothetical protein WKF58_15280 [Ilumatobacteraceae bacterium]
MPSVIDQITSRHSSSVTASCRVCCGPGRHHGHPRQPLPPHLLEHGRRGGFRLGGRLHHQLERGDARRGLGGEGGVEHQALGEVRLVADRDDLGPLVEDDVLIVTADGDVPGLVEQRRLVAERRVDRLHGHSRRAGDVGDRGAAVALLDEEVRAARTTAERLSSAWARRRVESYGRRLTGSPDFTTPSLYSLYRNCSE